MHCWWLSGQSAYLQLRIEILPFDVYRLASAKNIIRAPHCSLSLPWTESFLGEPHHHYYNESSPGPASCFNDGTITKAI